MAIVVALWAWRCGGSASNGANAAADSRADTGATPASGDRADNRPGAGTNQAAAQRSVGGVVRVRERGGR